MSEFPYRKICRADAPLPRWVFVKSACLLLLFKDDPFHPKVFDAISGLPGFYGDEHEWTRNYGGLPRSSEIEGEYSVSTESYYSAKARSLCFHITPDPVFPKDRSGETGPAGVRMRSELLIHADRPPTGKTNGCIGLDPIGEEFTAADGQPEHYDSDWTVFCANMEILRALGHESIPGEVI